jgi:hypothetical protein
MTGPITSMAYTEKLRLTPRSAAILPAFAAVFAWLATDPGLVSGPATWLFALSAVAYLGGGQLRTPIAALRHAVAPRVDQGAVGPYRQIFGWRFGGKRLTVGGRR